MIEARPQRPGFRFFVIANEAKRSGPLAPGPLDRFVAPLLAMTADYGLASGISGKASGDSAPVSRGSSATSMASL